MLDDGRIRAGSPLDFHDNGNGTITDRVTGLMWEKKSSRSEGLHAVELRLAWSGAGDEPTIWDWLDALNSEGERGFAGHNDWRIPNIKELVSIVDYGRGEPAFAPAFTRSQCAHDCGDPQLESCSCTARAPYWSSTTFSDFPAHALTLFAPSGTIGDRLKTSKHHVRAVRGGR